MSKTGRKRRRSQKILRKKKSGESERMRSRGKKESGKAEKRFVKKVVLNVSGF